MNDSAYSVVGGDNSTPTGGDAMAKAADPNSKTSRLRELWIEMGEVTAKEVRQEYYDRYGDEPDNQLIYLARRQAKEQLERGEIEVPTTTTTAVTTAKPAPTTTATLPVTERRTVADDTAKLDAVAPAAKDRRRNGDGGHSIDRVIEALTTLRQLIEEFDGDRDAILKLVRMA